MRHHISNAVYENICAVLCLIIIYLKAKQNMLILSAEWLLHFVASLLCLEYPRQLHVVMNYSQIDGDGNLLLKPIPHTVNQLITEWKAVPHEWRMQAEPLCYLVLTHLKERYWWEIKQDIKLWSLCTHIFDKWTLLHGWSGSFGPFVMYFLGRNPLYMCQNEEM